MPTKPEGPKRKRNVRSAVRGLGVKDIEELKRSVQAQTREEFERRWAQRFDPLSGFARSFAEWWKADCENKTVEDEARHLYENLLKRLDRIAEEAELFRKKSEIPDGAGGLATLALRHLEEAISHLQPISVLEDSYEAKLGRYARRTGRSAFVSRFRNAIPWLGGAVLTNREIAVVSLLVGAGPDGWVSYDRALKAGALVTAARVIEDEETRVRRLLNAPAEPIRTG